MYLKKKIVFAFFTIICVGCILFCSILCYKNIVSIKTESDLSGKEQNKEEYIYKEELLHLGYSINEIETIEKKISNIDVKNYISYQPNDDLFQSSDNIDKITTQMAEYISKNCCN